MKQAIIFCGLFLAVLFFAFYVVNFDFGRGNESRADAYEQDASLGQDIKDRLGSTILSMESYGDWAKHYGLSAENQGLDSDPDQDGLSNYLEYVHDTNPLQADTDGDGYSDKQEIVNGYDPDADFNDLRLATDLVIPKINVSVPMVWSNNEVEKDMLADLEKGVSHFAKTAAPGQNGNMIVSGHSSNYIWAKGDYNYIFKDLNNLETGDSVDVKTIQDNGRVIVYHYQVVDKYVTSPDDARIFADTQSPTLTLSTCWPLGTNFKRLIVKLDFIR